MERVKARQGPIAFVSVFWHFITKVYTTLLLMFLLFLLLLLLLFIFVASCFCHFISFLVQEFPQNYCY